MSGLVPYQKQEIEAIANDALVKTPPQYHQQLTEVFTYLAFCYAQDRNSNHLGDMQAIITAANARDEERLAQMRSHLAAEIQHLHSDLRLAFSSIGYQLGAVNQRLEETEVRLQRLEDAPRQLSYSDNRQYHYTDNRRTDRANNSPIVLLIALAIAGVMLSVQSRNVADTWKQINTQKAHPHKGAY